MAIQASVTNNQITASVTDTDIAVSVTGGVGPTGPQGPAGTSNLPAASEGQVLTYVSGAWTAASPTGGVSTTDPRLSDSREWSADTISQAEAEAGTATTRRAFTAARVFQAIAAWWAASAAKTKLDGIATGATANATDAQLRDRSTHTGTQAVGTITGLGGAATLNVGTAAGTVAAGNDSRFTDARTPLSHAHGNISNVGTLASGVMGAGSVGGPVVFDVLAGAVARGEFGSSAGQVCQGNDSRLSDARTPTGAAGGDLIGTYPNPQIAAGAVVTADLANSAVTYAKIQNVSATDRILGRSTAGAGVVEEITCTAFGRSLIDDADATAARTTLGLATVASSGLASDLTGTLADARLSTNARQSVEQFIHPFLLAGM